jgi:hypothetical protein
LCSLPTFLEGCITGRVYSSSNSVDGDYIETSAVADGRVENGYIVETISGSRYFLSAEKATDTAKDANIFAALNDLAVAKSGATITITKAMAEEERKERQMKQEDILKKLEKSKPRATFSLLDIFGGFFGAEPAKSDAPVSVPTLSRWKVNTDGTVTGVINGSEAIRDGNLVTTSPIVRGDLKKSSTVITQSGSMYFLT